MLIPASCSQTASPGPDQANPAGDRAFPRRETLRRAAHCERPAPRGYATDEAVRLVAFALSGELWTVAVADGRVRRLPAAGSVVDPRPDPAGERIAYVAGGALRVIEADGAADHAVAVPEGPDVTFGLAEHVAAESMGRTRGYWWAPDGRRLLTARVDSAAVQLWHICDPADPETVFESLRWHQAGFLQRHLGVRPPGEPAAATGPAGQRLTPRS